MQDIDFEEVEIDRSETDWIHCWVDGGAEIRYLEWQGRVGSKNLYEILTVFRSWVEQHDAA